MICDNMNTSIKSKLPSGGKFLIGKLKQAKVQCSTAVVAVQMMALEAYAAESDLTGKINNMGNSIYKLIVSISSVTAGTVAAVCLFLMFFSKNSNTVEESTRWLKRVAVCWVAIFLMSTILKFFTGNLGLDSNASLM